MKRACLLVACVFLLGCPAMGFDPDARGPRDQREEIQHPKPSQLEVQADAVQSTETPETLEPASEPRAVSAFQPVDLTKASLEKGQAYPVEESTVEVRDKLIDRVELPELVERADFTGSEAIVFMRNTTNRPIVPNFEIRIYNRYGMRLGSYSRMWLMDTIAAGGRYVENVDGFLWSLHQTLEYVAVELPPDIDKAAYVIVEHK